MQADAEVPLRCPVPPSSTLPRGLVVAVTTCRRERLREENPPLRLRTDFVSRMVFIMNESPKQLIPKS